MKCCSKENGLQTTDGKLVNGLLLCPLSKSISLKPITSRIHWYIPEIFSFPLLIGVIRRSKAGEKKRPMNGLFTGPQNKQTAGATVLLCIYVMTIMTLVVNSSITKLSQKRRTRKKKRKIFQLRRHVLFTSGEGGDNCFSSESATRPENNWTKWTRCTSTFDRNAAGRRWLLVDCQNSCVMIWFVGVITGWLQGEKVTIIRRNLVKAFIQVQMIVIFSSGDLCVERIFFWRNWVVALAPSLDSLEFLGLMKKPNEFYTNWIGGRFHRQVHEWGEFKRGGGNSSTFRKVWINQRLCFLAEGQRSRWIIQLLLLLLTHKEGPNWIFIIIIASVKSPTFDTNERKLPNYSVAS